MQNQNGRNRGSQQQGRESRKPAQNDKTDLNYSLTKVFNRNDMVTLRPLTETQKKVFTAYQDREADSNLLLTGSAGTGKSFLAMGLALQDVLQPGSPYKKLIIIRSTVSSREIGYLKGGAEEKVSVFEDPYKAICTELFNYGGAYDALKKAGRIEFRPTSFLRGNTLSDAVIMCDEIQNFSFMELDTAATRVGKNARLIMCGDTKQNDLHFKANDQSGLPEFLNIVNAIPGFFSQIVFNYRDIVRSPKVKAYIMAREGHSAEEIKKELERTAKGQKKHHNGNGAQHPATPAGVQPLALTQH